MRRLVLLLLTIAAPVGAQEISNTLGLPESTIYSVQHSLNMGSQNEKQRIDYYVNIGARHGVRRGAVLEVKRNQPSYDLVNRRLFKDMRFPIARLKVIHVERTTAIARLDKLLPSAETPIITPFAVMIGDSVQIAE